MSAAVSHYASMTALLAAEDGDNYTIEVRPADAKVAILAPHGGQIEPGTNQIAGAIAEAGYRLYCFNGHRRGGENYDYLHVTSHQYDEPRCRELIAPCDIVVAIHGCADVDRSGATIYLGGRDDPLREAIGETLRQAEFKVAAFPNTPDKFKGQHLNNICNLGRRRAGVQLELPRSLRRSLVPAGGTRGARFQPFVEAIRRAIHRNATQD